MNNLRSNQKGYAIIIVMILLVIGTVGIIMLSRQGSFFSKVSGFFNRNKKSQEQAEAGFKLATFDLQTVAFQSLEVNVPNLDTFISVSNSVQKAVNEGLYESTAASKTRAMIPRISRTDGDITMSVYYFPDDPCKGTCPNTGLTAMMTYRTLFPKTFMVISTATNSKTNETYTKEGRVVVRRTNYAEIAMGVTGQICFDTQAPYNLPPPMDPKTCQHPFPSGPLLSFSPAVYGRTHMNLPPDQIRFDMIGILPPDDPSQMHTFTDQATFQYATPQNQTYPFTVESVTKQSNTKNTIVNFEKGYQDNQQTFVTPYYDTGGGNWAANPHYTDTQDPSTDTYFQALQPAAAIDLSSRPCTASTHVDPSGAQSTVKQVDVCLKMVGTQVKEYECNTKLDHNMGRVDVNLHPSAGATAKSTFLAADTDRYVGEHAEVYNGTPAPGSSILGSATGMIYCYRTDCDCNIHIKGILDGQVTVAANNVVIEGDIQYQDQNISTSKDTFGIIAKKDVIIPAGVPQAANSEPSADTPQQQSAPNINDDSPTSSNTLAGAYLNITNFVAKDASNNYTSRNMNDPNYKDIAAKWDSSPTPSYLPSPSVLDIDGFIYAGNSVKVDGVFNSTASNSDSMMIQTCDDPPTCNKITYRDPNAPVGDPNALYADANGTLVDSTIVANAKVKPMFNIDGVDPVNFMAIDYNTGINGGATYGNYVDTGYNPGEEAPRALNPMLSVFGGISSKYYYIYDQMATSSGSGQFRIGFRKKIIQGDPRSSYLNPPSFPSTMNIATDVIYQKEYQGKSKLLP